MLIFDFPDKQFMIFMLELTWIIVTGIFKFARHYFCHDLEKQGRKYIRHHFKRILQESTEFKDLLCDELEAILRDDELNVKNEEIVFDAVKIWVEAKVEERRVYLPRLLKCIRYGLMSHKYFINNVVNWKLVEKDEVSPYLYHWWFSPFVLLYFEYNEARHNVNICFLPMF